jgi:hypothetical protein
MSVVVVVITLSTVSALVVPMAAVKEMEYIVAVRGAAKRLSALLNNKVPRVRVAAVGASR